MLLFGITYGFDWYARVLRLACGAAFLLLPLIQLLHLEGEDGVSEGEEGDTACGEAAAFARWSAALRVWYISVVASPPYWLTHSLIMAGLLTRRLLRAREGYSPPPISASSSDLDALKAELHSFDSSHPVREFFVTTKRDGVRLAVQAIGSGEEVLLCGHGLGCSAVFALPIMRRFDATEVFKHFTIVFWDYRGLFGSSGAGSGTEALPTAHFSVRDSAIDAVDVLDGVKPGCVCYAFIGYSTGVQVGLELAALHPDRVGRLVLLNGTHGCLLHSFLMPFFRIPPLGDWFHSLLRRVRSLGPSHWSLARRAYLAGLKTARYALVRPFCLLTASDYELYALNYVKDFFTSLDHSLHYLRVPMALDCHSAYYLLPEIAQPTLICAGMLDVLTPAYCSYEMAALMPNAELLVKTLGTHFILLEYPQDLANAIEEFLVRGNEVLLMAQKEENLRVG
mmetsp:Transcript_29479/g.94327  ORF Transcript_29479/g.94327 Transcript_29479/m.94327 type:complete len:452 (+) Transcript_29479:104-1459(+)